MDYKALAKKYDNFMAPAMKIFVNGTEVVSTLHLAVEGLSVASSLKQAGSVQFTIINAFQLNTRTFTDGIKSTFRLGNILEVALGYGSDTTKLFKGYIAELGMDFGETPVFKVTAFDLQRLLMDTLHQNYVYKVNSYSKAFETVMEGYQKFYDSLEVETTPNELKQIVQKDTDYRFIQELCAEADKEFMVIGGKVCFRTPAKNKTAVVSLDWGEGLMSFQKRYNQCNQLIRVYGMADDKREQLMVEIPVQKKESSTDFTIVKEYQNFKLIGQDAIQKYANQMALKQKDKSISGSGTCIGIPELLPGNYIQLGNLDSEKTEEYYIKSIRHNLGSGGFTTQFDVEGCKE